MHGIVSNPDFKRKKNQGDETSYCVSDNGIGIDPQYHELIFGLFNRLDQSNEGTGVGL